MFVVVPLVWTARSKRRDGIQSIRLSVPKGKLLRFISISPNLSLTWRLLRMRGLGHDVPGFEWTLLARSSSRWRRLCQTSRPMSPWNRGLPLVHSSGTRLLRRCVGNLLKLKKVGVAFCGATMYCGGLHCVFCMRWSTPSL